MGGSSVGRAAFTSILLILEASGCRPQRNKIMPDVFMNTREGKDAVAAHESKGSKKH